MNAMKILGPTIEAMREMYDAGYRAGLEEGRRQVFAQFANDLKSIQEIQKDACPSR